MIHGAISLSISYTWNSKQPNVSTHHDSLSWPGGKNKPFYFNSVEQRADFTAEICLRYPMAYFCALIVLNKLNRCNFFIQIVFSCEISRYKKRNLLLTSRELKRYTESNNNWNIVPGFRGYISLYCFWNVEHPRKVTLINQFRKKNNWG